MSCLSVALIGTGGGYGESVVVQMGTGNWMVIDSCINPATNESLPLAYLRSKGVDLEKEVKLVVCSHWHEDHILGLSELYKECTSAAFGLAIASDKDKFLKFIGMESRLDKRNAGTSSTSTMHQCLAIANERKNPVKLITQDKLLFNVAKQDIDVKVYALSPSDFVISEFGKEISILMTEYVPSTNRKIIARTPNEKCVALLVCVNEHAVILGADLEKSVDNRKGWLCILDNCTCMDGQKVSLYKVPHHGSENAYEERIWDELLNENVISQLAPCIQGKTVLPTSDMLRVFLQKTDNLFITSDVSFKGPKKRERSLEKAIYKFNPTLKEVKYLHGVIESSVDLESKDGWKTSLQGRALKITPETIEKFSKENN